MGENDSILNRVRHFARMVYPRHNFKGHIVPVVRIALELSDRLQADRRVVEAGAYLHDVGRVLVPYFRHETTGAYISDAALYLMGAEKDYRLRVVECIKHHSSPVKGISLEAEIVANADAIGQLSAPFYMFAIKYSHRKDLDRTTTWLQLKYEKDLKHKLTLPLALEFGKERYAKIMSLLKVQEWYCRG